MLIIQHPGADDRLRRLRAAIRRPAARAKSARLTHSLRHVRMRCLGSFPVRQVKDLSLRYADQFVGR